MIESSPGVKIRLVRPEDADALRSLRIEALCSFPLAFTADLAETEARPPAFWSELATRCAGDAADVILLADAGDRLAGMTGISAPKGDKLAHAGIVWGVFVRPEFRGRGLAEQLVRACINWARGRSLITLRLSVVVGNDLAKRCYERCGFVVYGVEPMAVHWQGKFYDETLMVLRL
jgi:RimJ/RimL family protein N-acetyltransferase